MKINEAALLAHQRRSPQPSLLSHKDLFSVSLHTADQFRRVLDFFDLFVRRHTTPTWKTHAQRHT